MNARIRRKKEKQARLSLEAFERNLRAGAKFHREYWSQLRKAPVCPLLTEIPLINKLPQNHIYSELLREEGRKFIKP